MAIPENATDRDSPENIFAYAARHEPSKTPLPSPYNAFAISIIHHSDNCELLKQSTIAPKPEQTKLMMIIMIKMIIIAVVVTVIVIVVVVVIEVVVVVVVEVVAEVVVAVVVVVVVVVVEVKPHFFCKSQFKR